MTPTRLTDQLLEAYPTELSAATTHPFLTAAGTGDLAPTALTRWLVQDKYYQFAYVNFIGRMISKLDLADYAFPSHGEDSIGHLKWVTLTTLLEALKAIKTEIDFYNSTVDKYELKLQKEDESKTTSEYRLLFEESSAVGKPVVWGLTVLWATEYCYLRAWSHAKEHSKKVEQSDKGAVAALHNEFIPNWTSDDFKAAVDALADVANAWADKLETGRLEECKKLWARVLDLETKFWPGV